MVFWKNDVTDKQRGLFPIFNLSTESRLHIVSIVSVKCLPEQIKMRDYVISLIKEFPTFCEPLPN